MELQRDRAYFLYRFGTGLLRQLPRPIAMMVMSLAANLAYVLSGGTRGVVTRNLRNVVGVQMSSRGLQMLVRSSFVSYGRYWADLAQLPKHSANDLGRYLDEQDLIEFVEVHKHKAAIIALPHIGSWEIAGLWANRHGYTVNTVAEPASSEALTDWFRQQRDVFGIHVFNYSDQVINQLLAALGRDELVTLVADRNIGGEGVEVSFFGETVKMPGGPALLALRSGCPLIPLAVYQDHADHHRPVLLPPISLERSGRLRDDVVRVTQDLAYAFEELIRKAPEQWHVFQPIWSDRNE
ncbi:MAG TPA: phosphatidylinositol mannoside acyltransferase [Acidimicrobiales bacterium]|nr:phosphatidylinositol mannoside acyltransferase [Acidimicrobiales bacterium]